MQLVALRLGDKTRQSGCTVPALNQEEQLHFALGAVRHAEYVIGL